MKSPKNTRYEDQNRDPYFVGASPDKKRQIHRIYKYPEDHTIPTIKIRSPKPGDEMYRPVTTQESSSAPLCFPSLPSQSAQYQPSFGVMDLIQRYTGPGVWPNPYPRNTWELLEPFEHRLTRASSYDLNSSPNLRPGKANNVQGRKGAATVVHFLPLNRTYSILTHEKVHRLCTKHLRRRCLRGER